MRKTNNISFLPVAHSSVSKKQKIKQKKPNAKYITSTFSEPPSRKRMLRKPSTNPNAGQRTNEKKKQKTVPIGTSKPSSSIPADTISPEGQKINTGTKSMYQQSARKSAVQPTSKSGFNHFTKFRKSINAPTFMAHNENIVANMINFWEYLKINSDINTSKTMSTYMSNVKMWHLYEHQKSGIAGNFPHWPTPFHNDELSKSLRDADKFFMALDAKKGEKRVFDRRIIKHVC